MWLYERYTIFFYFSLLLSFNALFMSKSFPVQNSRNISNPTPVEELVAYFSY